MYWFIVVQPYEGAIVKLRYKVWIKKCPCFTLTHVAWDSSKRMKFITGRFGLVRNILIITYSIILYHQEVFKFYVLCYVKFCFRYSLNGSSRLFFMTSLEKFSIQYGVSSSAWLAKVTLLLKKNISYKSLLNRSIPIMDPCDTSNEINIYELNWLFFLTLSLGSVKWSLIIFSDSKETSYTLSFFITSLWASQNERA